MADRPAPVLVAGASGYLGSYLAHELLRRGVPVRALVRSAGSQAAAALAAAGAEVRAVDVTRPGALVGVCDGCCAVASCLAADVHWRSGTPEAVDRDANIALFQAAAAAAAAAAAGGGADRAAAGTGGGLHRFLLVATYEGRDAKATVPLQRAKEAAVEYVQGMAADYGLTWTIVRPTAYFKDFTADPWRRMQAHSWMLVPGGGWAHYNPIDGAELAAFIADALLAPPGRGEYDNAEVQIGRPQVVTFRDTIYAAAEALGRRRQDVRVVSLPIPLLRCVAAALGLLGLLWRHAAVLSGALRFAAYSFTHDSVGLRYGRRTIHDHYRELRLAMQEAQEAAAPSEAARGKGD